MQALDEIFEERWRGWTGNSPTAALRTLSAEDVRFLQKVLPFYDKFASQNTDDTEMRFASTKAQRRIGESRHRLGDSEQAEIAFRQAIDGFGQLAKDDPDKPEYRFQLAVVCEGFVRMLVALRDDAAAEAAVQECVAFCEGAVEKFPQQVTESLLDVYRLQGDQLQRMGKTAESAQVFAKAVKQADRWVAADPNSEKYLERGDFYSRMGQWNRALADYSKMIELQPDNVGKAHALDHAAWELVVPAEAQLPERRGVIEFAKECADRAVQLNPEADYWNTHGVLLYRLGDWDGSIASLRKAMELARGQRESWKTFFLAMAYHQLGQTEVASDWLRQAVEWMETNAWHDGDGELKRLRAEAEQLMGVLTGKPKTFGPPTAPTETPAPPAESGHRP